VTDDLECRASVERSALNGAGAPVEHVKTHCPGLIATLVAIARAAERQHGVEHEQRCASSDGRSLVSREGRSRRVSEE
jgi:hypothetical protein